MMLNAFMKLRGNMLLPRTWTSRVPKRRQVDQLSSDEEQLAYNTTHHLSSLQSTYSDHASR
jgi:hypothetical protein